MIRKPKTTGFWVGRLPHWEVEEGRYFVTLHLAGAIPAPGRARLGRIAEELRRIPEHAERERLRLQRRIFAEMERWLDRSTWNPLLGQKPIAEMVTNAIRHRHERGDWQVWQYVVMPTHLHLFCEAGGRGLKYALEDFKRWTGHEAGRILNAKGEHSGRMSGSTTGRVPTKRTNESCPISAKTLSEPAWCKTTKSGRTAPGRSCLPGGTLRNDGGNLDNR